ncbi:hypothetical protein BpHYR1_016438 [Brachionus plicatilis]|uniref:Uncharacterized protein n=1 Tax=Brachionus plicatilis TaxID=10195 RepID=A0A3M7QYH3_BRAPC|nr:hypothetical protein BpHYR1_016438 [Brachionus plicatilis]
MKREFGQAGITLVGLVVYSIKEARDESKRVRRIFSNWYKNYVKIATLFQNFCLFLNLQVFLAYFGKLKDCPLSLRAVVGDGRHKFG